MAAVYRTEQHQFKKSDSSYRLLDDLCFKSKNLYNLCLYEQRQTFFKYGTAIDYNRLYHTVKNSDDYKNMISAAVGQSVIRQVATTFNSYFKAMKGYYKNPDRFLGRPQLPKYKHKEKGRNILEFNNQVVKVKNGYIQFPKKLNGFTIKTKAESVEQVRIIPKLGRIIVEVVYMKEIENVDTSNLKYAAGIDIGIDNFAAISVWNNTSKPIIINGKGLKSYNKYFNKKLAHLKSEAATKNKLYSTHRIQRLQQKRNNYMQNFMHQASKKTVDYLIENGVKHLVIGNSKKWKQNSKLSKVTNQTFVQIPYAKYVQLLTYKAQEHGILVYYTEESFTSGTSFLDNEQPTSEFYNKSRRVHRGLFKSNIGIELNAEVNASYQITKKVFSNLHLYPTPPPLVPQLHVLSFQVREDP